MATYHTRQKEAILALLTDSRGEALSASELLARLTRSGSSIGRTTVYRLLSQLVDDGVVRAWRDASRGITLYELSVITDCADVRCRKCERIFHLHCQALAALQTSVHDHLDASHGFLLDPVAPQFTGLCPECRAKES